jgi:hypothetical protein
VKLVVAAIAVVAAVAWAWERHDRQANERALGRVASALAGRPVEIRCQGFWSAFVDIRNRTGEVRFENGELPDHAFLTRKACRELKRFRAAVHPQLDCLRAAHSTGTLELDGACARGAHATAEAISTLAHEAMHLRGFMAEAQAQCYAIQSVAWTAVGLGGTAAEGAALAALVLGRQPALPAEYQSSDCRAGGALDLRPGTAAFPTEAEPAPPPAGLYGPALPR